VSGREAWLAIDQKTLYEHQTNLEVRLSEAKQRQRTLTGRLDRTLTGRLDNESYIAKAPAELVEATKKEAEEVQQLIERLENELTVIGS